MCARVRSCVSISKRPHPTPFPARLAIAFPSHVRLGADTPAPRWLLLAPAPQQPLTGHAAARSALLVGTLPHEPRATPRLRCGAGARSRGGRQAVLWCLWHRLPGWWMPLAAGQRRKLMWRMWTVPVVYVVWCMERQGAPVLTGSCCRTRPRGLRKACALHDTGLPSSLHAASNGAPSSCVERA